MSNRANKTFGINICRDGGIPDCLSDKKTGNEWRRMERRDVLSGWFLSNYCEGFIRLVNLSELNHPIYSLLFGLPFERLSPLIES